MTDELLRPRGTERADASPTPVHKRRRRPSVLGILGEVLITLGVLVLLFIVWQQWFNNIVVAEKYRAQSHSISEQLDKKAKAAPTPVATPNAQGSYAPAVTPQPGNTQVFGVLYVPRFGAQYSIPLAGGTTTAGTLDKIGVGHYDNTQMPGEIGNFAVAGHRTTHAAPFNKINTLQLGDKIFVKTAEGWYTYSFRNLEYVKPTEVSVLQAVPDAPTVDPSSTDRLMTMTSCNPLYSATERIVAYSVFSSYQPLSAGIPAGLPASEVNG